MPPAPETLRRTRIVCISDTHNSTPRLPEGDVLIHAGDLTNQGSYSEVQSPFSIIPRRPCTDTPKELTRLVDPRCQVVGKHQV
jgi:3',5'-cyclic AMP phosphodiesterase CpdA